MCPISTLERGIHQTRSRVTQASEPERNSKNPSQFIEKLSVARFQQASPSVQMQWKSGASEPRSKAESISQPTYNKHIAGLSVTVPVVQMSARFGTQRKREASEPERNSKNHCNTLRNFLLHGCNKHLHRFRCGGKE